MSDQQAREIFERLNAIDKQLAGLVAMLDEKNNACLVRHGRWENVCTVVTEAKGGWKMLVTLSALIGGAVGAVISGFVKGH